jgi:hypothetical protein
VHQSRDSFAKIWPELEDFPQIYSAFLRYGLSEEKPLVHFGFAQCRLSTPFNKLWVCSLPKNKAR